jgi:hypothetical protein
VFARKVFLDPVCFYWQDQSLQGHNRGGVRVVGAEGEDAVDGKVNGNKGAGMNGEAEGEGDCEGESRGL